MVTSMQSAQSFCGTFYAHLNESRPLVLKGPMRIRVLGGRAWITVDGRPDDWFVGSGESFDLPAGVRTIIQGDPDCVIGVPQALASIRPVPRPGLAGALTLAWRAVTGGLGRTAPFMRGLFSISAMRNA